MPGRTAYKLFADAHRAHARDALAATGLFGPPEHAKVSVAAIARKLAEMWSARAEEERAEYERKAEDEAAKENVAPPDEQEQPPLPPPSTSPSTTLRSQQQQRRRHSASTAAADASDDDADFVEQAPWRQVSHKHATPSSLPLRNQQQQVLPQPLPPLSQFRLSPNENNENGSSRNASVSKAAATPSHPGASHRPLSPSMPPLAPRKIAAVRPRVPQSPVPVASPPLPHATNDNRRRRGTTHQDPRTKQRPRLSLLPSDAPTPTPNSTARPRFRDDRNATTTTAATTTEATTTDEEQLSMLTADPLFVGANTYAALVWNPQRQTVGVASYSSADRTLRACEFAEDGRGLPSFLGIRTVLAHIQPDLLVVPPKLDMRVAEACVPDGEEGSENSDGDGGERTGQWTIRQAPPSCFQLDSAQEALARLKVETWPIEVRAPNGTPMERLRHLAAHVAICDGTGATLVALGSLLRILTATGVVADGSLSHTPSNTVDAAVYAVLPLTAEGLLAVDALTMRALHVFAPQRHPSAMGIGSTREGFSLYGMLSHYTQTGTGRDLLRLWLARPLIDAERVKQRLDAVAALALNDDLRVRLSQALSRTRDIGRLLTRIRRGTGGVAPADVTALRDWCLLRNGCNALMGVRNAFRRHASGGALCGAASAIANNALLSSDAEAMSFTVGEIDAVLDFGESDAVMDDTRAHHLCVRRGVDPELDRLKDAYAQLPERLTRVARHEALRALRALEHGLDPSAAARRTWRVVYLPALLGYVVRLDRPLEESILDDVYTDYQLVLEDGTGWVTPATGGASELQTEEPDGALKTYYYYRCDATRKLDAELGDIFSRIRAGEDSVLLTLTGVILERETSLRACAHGAAEIDCLVALASCAQKLGWTRPRIVGGSGVLNLQGVWHPLLAVLANGAYVPNDVQLGGGNGRLLVNAAPNCSGKSALASAVALTSYLAHCGSFVPAEKADVAILDAIISAKLGDAASASGAGALAIGSSTFCTDVRRVGLLCRRATRRSLVVLDEFGDGTRSGDGLGLLSALLHHLATRSTGAPFAMVQTHFSELFDPVVLPKHANIQLCTMAVEELEEEDGGCKDICFRYRLATDSPPGAFGVQCARRAGMPRAVVERANEVVKALAIPGTGMGARAVATKEMHIERLVRALETAALGTTQAIATT